MYKEIVLTLSLLVALACRAQANEGHPIYGVKLCGREFIRAVIFTCGGSRWRRSVGMPGETGDLASDFFSTHDDEASDSWSSQLIPHLSYKAQADPEVDGLASEGPDSLAFIRPARSLISDEVLEALRTSDRKGRDVVVGLSNACCKWGCSKSEISSLC
ncbi:relaxin-3b [Pangasianodon hypophthalmus]|uniref:relaxin-3b n=1 Tax=Pangasianodon hypophthalmus TaxID=310915 RepID=UPI000EFDF0EC|nr:relaxin-3b [Pangasianodon hypophthalmus]